MSHASAIGVTAPGRVRQLAPLWEELTQERRSALALRWLDASIRRMLPHAFERFGAPELAPPLRALAPIDDVARLAAAIATLEALAIPDEPTDLVTAYFGVLAPLKEHLLDPDDVGECCFTAVMASRLVYGDDRFVDEMRTELEGAARA